MDRRTAADLRRCPLFCEWPYKGIWKKWKFCYYEFCLEIFRGKISVRQKIA